MPQKRKNEANVRPRPDGCFGRDQGYRNESACPGAMLPLILSTPSLANNEAIRQIEGMARVSNIVSLKPRPTPRSVVADEGDTWLDAR